MPSAATEMFIGSLWHVVRLSVLNTVAPVPYIISSGLKGFIETPVSHQPGFS